MNQKNRVLLLLTVLVLLTFGVVLETQQLTRQAIRQDVKRDARLTAAYRQEPVDFFTENRNRRAVRTYLPYTKSILSDIRAFPIALQDRARIGYEDSFGNARSYGGDRSHEGCDLMDGKNQRGEIVVVSMTAGTVSKLGWLKLGGWRIGILSDTGIYYYYAHLDSYVKGLQVGDAVYAGQPIGFMGDTGYGEEGTTGQFPVHLHVGIYYYDSAGQEISVNPYPFLIRIDASENVVK